MQLHQQSFSTGVMHWVLLKTLMRKKQKRLAFVMEAVIKQPVSSSGLEVMALQKMMALLQMIASVELERVTLLNRLVEGVALQMKVQLMLH